MIENNDLSNLIKFILKEKKITFKDLSYKLDYREDFIKKNVIGSL